MTKGFDHARYVSQKTLAVTILIVIAAWLMVAHFIPGASNAPPGSPWLPIEALAPVLDIGSTHVDHDTKVTAILRNVSSYPVKIEGFTSSCSCVDISPSKFKLSPGGRETVTLTLDTARSPSEALRTGHSAYSISFFPYDHNRKPLGKPTVVRGNVTSPVIVHPVQVEYGENKLIVGEPPVMAEIELTESEPLQDVQVASTSPRVTIERRFDSARRRHVLTITPLLDSEIGQFREMLQVRVITRSNRIARFDIPVIGVVVNDVDTSPRILSMFTNGGEASAVIALVSRVGRSFIVAKSHFQGQRNQPLSVSVTAQEQNAHTKKFLISVSDSGSGDGTKRGVIVFSISQKSDSSDGARTYEVAVPLTVIDPR